MIAATTLLPVGILPPGIFGPVEVPQSLAPFRNRRFALLWSGAFVSNIGTWMETVAVGILVTASTGKAGWAGLVAAAGFVPTAVLAPVGGALADRVSRRTVLLCTTVVQATFATGLTVLTVSGNATPGLVTLFVLGAGCANALGVPAFQAMLPDLVARADVPSAVALTSAQWNLGRVIGPALAGIVIGVGGYEIAFAINAVSFIAVFAVVASFKLPPPARIEGESIIQAIRAGARFMRGDPAMRFVIACAALFSLLIVPFVALIPAVALKVFDDEKFGTAALVTAQGLGSVTMALMLGVLHHRFGHRRSLIVLLFAVPTSLVAYACSPTLLVAVVAMFVVGYFYLGAWSSFTTITQLTAPRELRGRAVSVLQMLLGALYPVGAVVQGAIADEIGLRATTAGAAILFGGSLLVWRLFRPTAAAALDEIEVEGNELEVAAPEHVL
jgi:MFS family permease